MLQWKKKEVGVCEVCIPAIMVEHSLAIGPNSAPGQAQMQQKTDVQLGNQQSQKNDQNLSVGRISVSACRCHI